MNLDDPASFAAVDVADALGDLEGSPDQWRRARALADVRLPLEALDAIVVTGVGGSGIVGDVVAALGGASLQVPLAVHKSYGLPAFVGPRSLVVAVSYSGHTEETLSAYAEALERGTHRFAVTSGGRLGELAQRAGDPMVRVPPGCQPRHAFGYLTVPVLVGLGLDADLDEAPDVLDAVSARCDRRVPSERNEAKRVAARIAEHGISCLLGGQPLGALAAYRLKCQLNENAKLPVACAQLPEANHNEVVGWDAPSPLTSTGGLLALRDPIGEHPRVARRFAVTEPLAQRRFAWVGEISAEGRGELSRLASLLLVSDLVSVYTALALDRDPSPIPAIHDLKAALGHPMEDRAP